MMLTNKSSNRARKSIAAIERENKRLKNCALTRSILTALYLKYEFSFLEIYKKYRDYGITQRDIKKLLVLYGILKRTRSETVKTKRCQKKRRRTNLKKYGVPNPFRARMKEYIFPSGKKVMVQGYEPYMLDRPLFDEKIQEKDIIVGLVKIPKITWIDNVGKKHLHYPDIFIPSQNRLIEVKSTWTGRVELMPIILAKKEAAEKLGYRYDIEIIIPIHEATYVSQ